MASTSEPPATDAWNEKDQRIEVTEGAGPNSGTAIGLRLRAKIDGSPSLVYQILTDPNCVEVFRNIKVGWAGHDPSQDAFHMPSVIMLQACTFRKVLEVDHHKKTRKLEVEHRYVPWGAAHGMLV